MQSSHDVFVSFADSDREIAIKLRELFRIVNLSAYVAPVDLPRVGEPRWRTEIAKAIKDSAVFLPVFTKRSVNRRWVMYELGVADCAGKKVFATRTANISCEEIQSLPGVIDPWVYDLSQKQALCDVLLNVAVEAGRSREQIQKLVETMVERAPEAESVMKAARTRWVFIAGSRPRESPTFSSLRSDTDSGASPEKVLEQISRELSLALLRSGFSVSACPEVPHVGVAAAQAVTSWLTLEGGDVERFRIRGMYPIDRTLRDTVREERHRSLIQRMIDEYRQSYLPDVEAMIVLGGNEGTEEEINAGIRLGVKIFCIPQIGGTAERMYNKLGAWMQPPLHPQTTVWRSDCAEAIVKALG